jgi:hypothetical protein
MADEGWVCRTKASSGYLDFGKIEDSTSQTVRDKGKKSDRIDATPARSAPYTDPGIRHFFFFISFYFFESDQSTFIIATAIFSELEGVIKRNGLKRPIFDDGDVVTVDERDFLVGSFAVRFDG